MTQFGIPITLVSGFLGAGKTTLINEILKKTSIPADEIAIIVNEFGEVGIDHQLLIQSEEKIYQLNNGCICCTLRSDLAEALMAVGQFFEDQNKPLRHVIIETTGIADPAPIIQTISLSPVLSQAFQFDAVITLVDCLNFDYILDQNQEVLQQISYADRFILSKTEDLEPDQVQAIISQLSEINPLADYKYFILEDGFDPVDFFDLGLFNRIVEPMDVEVCEVCGHTHADHHHHDHDHDHHHLDHHHDHGGFMSLVLTSQVDLDEPLFLQWLDWLLMTFNGKLYRYKGLLNLKDRDLMIAIQGVNVAYRFDMTPYEQGDHPTQIVLIGKELDEDLIRLSFDELVEMSQLNH